MDNLPLWWKMINLDESLFSKTDGKWQLRNYTVLNKIGKNMYDAVGQDVKEFNECQVVDGNNQKNVKLGKKIASIPTLDYIMHPELQHDSKALIKYLEEHPECRVQRSSKSGDLAKGSGIRTSNPNL